MPNNYGLIVSKRIFDVLKTNMLVLRTEDFASIVHHISKTLYLLFHFLFISDRDWIPRVDERDQTVIPAGAGHDACGRENHEFWSSLHHAIQQRRKRTRHAMNHPFSRTYPVMYIHAETEKSSLNKPYGYWSCTVERDVENRRYMIGSVAVHHLSWPVFRHAKYYR